MRVDTLFQRIQKLIPPPDGAGWNYTRMQLEAAALGSPSFSVATQDEQAEVSEEQLYLSKRMQRSDADPTNWDTSTPTSWRFSVVASPSPGATDYFLDAWGRTLGVGRLAGEADPAYTNRILVSLTRPTTTNNGMAAYLEDVLGISPIQVVEAVDSLDYCRLNDERRSDDSDVLLNSAMDIGSPYACFIVEIPESASALIDTVSSLVNGKKAAGTRLVGVRLVIGGDIIAAGAVTVASVVTAYTAAVLGATYAWTVTGGVIDSGAGTNSITYHATSEGVVTLSVVVTDGGNSSTHTKLVNAYNALPLAITVDEYMQPGLFGATASLASSGSSLTVAWSATGLDIEGPSNQPTVAFDTGLPGTLATLTAVLHNGSGDTSTISTQIKILPYPVDYSLTTAALAIGDAEWRAVDMGKKWDGNRLTSDLPARVRIYESAAQRAADASRPAGVNPTGDHGLLFEAVTTAMALDVVMKPWAYAYTPTNVAYVSIQNTGLAGAVITATIGTMMKER